jgi:hypothetical protein
LQYQWPGSAKTVSNGGLYGNVSGQAVPNGTIRYVHDGDQCVEEYDDSGDLLRQYVWGQYIDELVQQREYAKAPVGLALIFQNTSRPLHQRSRGFWRIAHRG